MQGFDIRLCRIIPTAICVAMMTCPLAAAKISFSTFFGGSEWEHARDVYVNDDGFDYVVAAKFSPTGALMCCTYMGGSADDGPDGVYANSKGEVFFTGTTSSPDFPTTADALQSRKSGKNDAIIVGLNSDFSKLIYSSYLGGESYDDGRSFFLDKNGSAYIVGSTNGPGWPSLRPAQAEFAGGGGGKELCYQGGCYAGEVIITKIVF